MLMVNFSENEPLNILDNLYLMLGISLIVSCLLGWKFQKKKHAAIEEPRIFLIRKAPPLPQILKTEIIISIVLTLLTLGVFLTKFKNGSILLQALLFARVGCDIYARFTIWYKWRRIVTTSSSSLVKSAYLWLKICHLTNSIFQIPLILLSIDLINYAPFVSLKIFST